MNTSSSLLSILAVTALFSFEIKGAEGSWVYSGEFAFPNTTRPGQRGGIVHVPTRTYDAQGNILTYESGPNRSCFSEYETSSSHNSMVAFHYGQYYKWKPCDTTPKDKQFVIKYSLYFKSAQSANVDAHYGSSANTATAQSHGHYLISSKPSPGASKVHDYNVLSSLQEGGSLSVMGTVGFDGRTPVLNIGASYTFSSDVFSGQRTESSGLLDYFFNSGTAKYVEGRVDCSADIALSMTLPNGSTTVFVKSLAEASVPSFNLAPN